MNQFKFLSHKSHNPYCDIVVNRISIDAEITWGIYISGPNAGQEFCEYYSGPNYIPNSSNKKSYSRCWKDTQDVPKVYRNAMEIAKAYYLDIMIGGLPHIIRTNI